CKQTLEPNVANTVAFALTKVFSTSPWGTGWTVAPGLADGRPVAGKTGTTNYATQSWFTGFTPELSTSVWVGEASGETRHMNVRLPAAGWYSSAKVGRLFGSAAAVPTWRRYMDQAVADLPRTAFPAPDPKLVGKKSTPPKQEKKDDGGGENGGGEGGGNGGGPGGGGNGGGNGGGPGGGGPGGGGPGGPGGGGD